MLFINKLGGVIAVMSIAQADVVGSTYYFEMYPWNGIYWAETVLYSDGRNKERWTDVEPDYHLG